MTSLINPSFEGLWVDDIIIGTKNQVPNGWNLTYLQMGETLKSAGVFADLDHEPVYEIVETIPECVHKGLFGDTWNLPENERPDGSTPLILDGIRTYNIFSNYNPFSAQLNQTVRFEPGTTIRLHWPVNTHHQNDGSPGAAAWRVGLNNVFCDWKTFEHGFTDREWTLGQIDYTVPANGEVFVWGQFESRALAGIDFFMDDIYIEVLENPVIIEDGDPRVPYERTYLLLPGKSVLSRAETTRLLGFLSNQIYDYQWTVGFSADDAGIGKLPVRRVIVISLNEDDWDKKALLDFYSTYYPGVIVEFYDFEQLGHFPVGTDEYPPKYWYVPTTQLFTSTHFGIDLNLDISPWGDVERGFPIYSVLNGTVYYTTDDWGGVGMCVIEHELEGETFWIQYAHVDLTVTETQQVTAGQKIGVIANWIKGDGGDHLHFGVSTRPITREYVGWKYFIDPVKWLKRFISAEIVDASIKKDGIVPEPGPGEIPVFMYPLRSNNLIGLHSGFTKEMSFPYIEESGTTIQKFFSAGDAYIAKQKAPNMLSVWRKYVGNEQGRVWEHSTIREAAIWYLDQYTAEIETARKNMNLTLEQFLERKIALESLNETIPSFNAPVLKNVVEFDVHFCDVAHERYGNAIETVLLCGAIGNPHESEVPLLLPAAEIAYAHEDYIGYHDYFTANEHRSFLTEHWKYHAGRWTEWDKYFTSKGVYPKYASGEIGIVYAYDGVSFDSGKGWKACGSFEDYLKSISTFNTLVLEWNKTHNNRFVGGTLFGYGNWGWDSFELGDGDIRLLIEWSKSL